MKVLITGGAGFIGSTLADTLLAAGNEVLALDNFATGRRDSLDLAKKGLRLVEGTIADTELVANVWSEFRPEVVVHAAASYKDPDAWAEDARTNVVGTANVVRASADAGVRRLIYLQTALCYGLHPIEQPISISHPLRPGASSYAISKTAGEHYVALSGLDWVSFRLANVYGPRNISGPLPTFYARLTTGRPCFVMDTRRDFVFVDDLVDILTLAIRGTGRTGVYHVSSGDDVSIAELFAATLAALNLPPDPSVEVRPRGPDDAFTILLDPRETQSEFGWEAKTPLAIGVARAIDYYQTMGITDTFTHLKLDGLRASR
jgi:UDP-glucose 4-epimerase